MCVCKGALARYLIALATGTLLTAHSHKHTLLRPLSSRNTFPPQVTQQINHHGYSNVIIAVLEGGSDWWCLQGHLEISNCRETMTIHLAAEWMFERLFDPLSRMECRKHVACSPPPQIALPLVMWFFLKLLFPSQTLMWLWIFRTLTSWSCLKMY